MKLSLWTICTQLEARRLEPQPSITEGFPRISAYRRHDAGACPLQYAEILAAGEGVGDVIVRNGADQLLIPAATAAEVGNCLSEIFEYYNRWEQQLYTRVVEGASLQELLDAANSAFARPMFIKNDSSWTFAITRGYPADVHPNWTRMERSVGKRMMDYDAMRVISTSPEFRNVFQETYPTVARSPVYGGMILHANIFLSGRRVAEIIALENGVPFNRGEVHLMHVFAELLEKYVRSKPEILISVSDPATFLSALIEKGGMREENLPLIYRSAHLSPEDELCVAAIQSKNRLDSPVMGVLRDELESQMKNAAVFSYKGRVVCVAGLNSRRSYDETMRQLAALVPQDTFLWGSSYEFADLRELAVYYEQAVSALERAEALGRRSATMYEVAGTCIAELCAGCAGAERLIHPDLLRLRAADARDKAQYSETLFQFLLCGGNYTDAAARLGLHRNSLIYRMNKIRGVMHTNPDELENRELLMFSYLLLGQK